MSNSINRRSWLRQSALAFVGMHIAPAILSRDLHNSKSDSTDNIILLNSNENAYGPSPLARKAILESYLNSNRYPDDYVPLLKKKLAAHWNVSVENILLGAGASEIIGLICQLAAKEKGHIITTEPSYKVWNAQASSFGLSFKRSAFPKKNDASVASLFGPVSSDTRMIYICNPNNPTGTVLDTKEVQAYALQVPKQTLVVIDEAYAEYAQLETLAPIAVTSPNVIVTKTFSKIYGLAGARVGYAIANPALIKALSAFQPWPDSNVSMVSVNAAMASLDDNAFVNDCREKVNKGKQICYSTFDTLGSEYIPSSTNFILFNIDKIKKNLTYEMSLRNIEVQFREHFGGKWCRVSIGTIEEMQTFTGALKEIAAN